MGPFVNSKQDSGTIGNTSVENMSDTIRINIQLHVGSNRPSVKQIFGPIITAEVHLMEGSIFGSHKSPFKPVWSDVHFQMRWIHIFKDGPCMPSGALPIILALSCISPHFEIITIGIKDTWPFLLGHGYSAVYEFT